MIKLLSLNYGKERGLNSARTKKRIFCQGQNQYLGKIKILTAGIHEVFRGLKFLVDADIGKKGLFRSDTM